MSDRRKVLELFEKHKDYIDKRVSSGIELYRKGYGVITVKDKDGNVVPNAKVKISQKSHEFKYGTNLFMLDELETEEKNAKYKEIMANFGNMATLPFYWNATEPEKGKLRYDKDSEKFYRRPPIDLCMEFCEEHGIEPREHALAYAGFFPKWLKGESDAVAKRELERRYKEISERYADKINTIEVTNEMFWGGVGLDFYRSDDYVEWCFKLAEKYFPANQLVTNEVTGYSWGDNCSPTDRYYSYIAANMAKGARIDAIGMQYHQFNKREDEYNATRTTYSPLKLFWHLDMYAKFGKPIHITEVTIPSYSWEEEDEAIQAEIIEQLYSIWFSHPAVEQIIYWNMVDGYAHLWNPDTEQIKASQGNMSMGENYYHGGLLRFDMTPKPAYYTIKNLFEKKWHTEDQKVTNQNGEFKFTGFYGKYNLEIEADGKLYTKEINLSKSSRNIMEISVG